MPQHSRTHGQYGTPLYWAWTRMKARCAHHHRYVAVSVDPRWLTFEGFAANPPAGEFRPGMHLARFGDAGDYSPENCRWLTREANSREAIEPRMMLLPDGRRADDVARANGIHCGTWHARVKRGWDVQRAVTTPAKNKGKNRPLRQLAVYNLEVTDGIKS
jgi:hypothetical protein